MVWVITAPVAGIQHKCADTVCENFAHPRVCGDSLASRWAQRLCIELAHLRDIMMFFASAFTIHFKVDFFCISFLLEFNSLKLFSGVYKEGTWTWFGRRMSIKSFTGLFTTYNLALGLFYLVGSELCSDWLGYREYYRLHNVFYYSPAKTGVRLPKA